MDENMYGYTVQMRTCRDENMYGSTVGMRTCMDLL